MSFASTANVQFDDRWPALLGATQSAISTSRYGSIDPSSWHKRFPDVYRLCTASPNPHAQTLYEKTKNVLEEHCQTLYEEIAESEQNMLSVYSKHWSEYNIGAARLNMLYDCLNKSLVKNRPLIGGENYAMWEYMTDLDERIHLEIGELALECWKKIIFEPSKDRLIRLLLEQIHLDRIGEGVNQTIIKDVVMSFVDLYQYRKSKELELYEQSFEAPFLEATGEYYRKESDRRLTELSPVAYMKKALLLIDDERFRSRKFLNHTSYKKVEDVCFQRLVCDHSAMITGECNNLLLTEDLEALHNMYQLLKPTDIGIGDLVERLEANISRIGHERIQWLKEENLSTSFVEALLEIQGKYTRIIHDIFANDADCISALDKACATIVNVTGANRLRVKPAELLAQYCDSLLRKSAKTYSESELEEKLTDAVRVFNYLDDKDYFHRFYQKMFARRLINQQSNSMDSEESMISKLKQMCGYEFTSKLTRMFQDVKVSDDLNVKFLDSLRSEPNSTEQSPSMSALVGLDFNIYVLQANSWPITPPVDNTFAIPHLLEKPMHMFESFYNSQHNGRRLSWIYNLSTADIRMSQLDRPYLVTAGTYQTAILLLFNDHQQLPLSEIEETTKIPLKELQKQISILIDNRLLLSDRKDLSLESIVSVNTDFQNKRTKLKLPTATQKEVNQETETTEKALEEDRKFYLQAVIVRIMKARGTLNHNSLIEEVCIHSRERFSPSIPLIKKCIEILIEKQYMNRNASDEYSYVA